MNKQENKELAGKEDPASQFLIGLAYAVGKGCPLDVDKGWEIMSEALEKGVKIGQRQMEGLQEILTTPLSEYYDAELKIQFPGKDCGLKSISRYLPKSLLGYSLRYSYTTGDTKLDVYVYNPYPTPVPDGISEKTQKEIEQAAMVVKYMEQMGRYKNIREASSKGNGKLKASGLDYSWQSFCYDPEDRKDLWSVILAFGARGKIIKYRYTSPIRVLLQGDEKAIDELLKKEAFLPPMMTFILNMMDQELSKGQ